MKILLSLLIIFGSFSILAKTQYSGLELKIYERCLSKIKKDKKQTYKEICICYIDNLKKQMDDDQIKAIYKDSMNKLSEANILKHYKTLEFDRNVASECYSDPKWKLPEKEKEKDL